ncbi:Caffeoyl-CoA O-methyltransferase 1 [Hibiscus syriacus]|uniref:Caffeoyl-CoA O-methyltransferase 1 n=1 Tax=Hibiscus syriacus TaxID=106335 RepID=A0A6A3BWJ4_HIBSY|nr:Caffeoyl-CoA O-methyltransferase 1 [Hibiscus syriacus]
MSATPVPLVNLRLHQLPHPTRIVAKETKEEEQQSQAGRHQEVGHKSLLQSDALYQYILETSVYPREPKPMKELREITAKHPWNIMTTSADEGQFLNMILKLRKLRGLPVIQKAGVAHKIDFKEGPAMPVLDELVQDRLIELVKVGGLIGYDNTLWNGTVVASPDAPLRKYVRYYRDFVLELNKALAVDPRIEICMLPVAQSRRYLVIPNSRSSLAALSGVPGRPPDGIRKISSSPPHERPGSPLDDNRDQKRCENNRSTIVENPLWEAMETSNIENIHVSSLGVMDVSDTSNESNQQPECNQMARANGKPSYVNIVSGASEEKQQEAIPIGVDNVIVLEEDCIMDKSGSFPMIRFSNRVHEQFGMYMRNVLIELELSNEEIVVIGENSNGLIQVEPPRSIEKNKAYMKSNPSYKSKNLIISSKESTVVPLVEGQATKVVVVNSRLPSAPIRWFLSSKKVIEINFSLVSDFDMGGEDDRMIDAADDVADDDEGLVAYYPSNRFRRNLWTQIRMLDLGITILGSLKVDCFRVLAPPPLHGVEVTSTNVGSSLSEQ